MFLAVVVTRAMQDFLPERVRPLHSGDSHFSRPWVSKLMGGNIGVRSPATLPQYFLQFQQRIGSHRDRLEPRVGSDEAPIEGLASVRHSNGTCQLSRIPLISIAPYQRCRDAAFRRSFCTASIVTSREIFFTRLSSKFDAIQISCAAQTKSNTFATRMAMIDLRSNSPPRSAVLTSSVKSAVLGRQGGFSFANPRESRRQSTTFSCDSHQLNQGVREA